jgi:hypothetical protein
LVSSDIGTVLDLNSDLMWSRDADRIVDLTSGKPIVLGSSHLCLQSSLIYLQLKKIKTTWKERKLKGFLFVDNQTVQTMPQVLLNNVIKLFELAFNLPV